MTIYGNTNRSAFNTDPSAARPPTVGSLGAELQQHQNAAAADAALSEKNAPKQDVESKLQQDIISSMVNLTDDAEAKREDGRLHDEQEKQDDEEKSLVPSSVDAGLLQHSMDDDEEDGGWNLDGSHDSSHGLLASGGLGSNSLSPFTSRAHAAAAFGRLAKRAITFGDLIAAVDAFTAAYGQLEQTEQRIVIARMYFLNRQLLYCQHDIIRQKQSLAIAALAEQQAKMVEAGHSLDAIAGPGMLPPSEALAEQFMGSPDLGFFGGSPNAFTSHFVRSMIAAEQSAYAGMMQQQHSPQDLHTPLATFSNNSGTRSKAFAQPHSAGIDVTATPSPVLKPGVPLVQIRRSEPCHPLPSAKLSPQPPVQQQYSPAHSGVPVSQNQPVRLDAKSLMLLQYLQNGNTSNNTASQTPSPLMSSKPSVTKSTPSDGRQKVMDVGIQVSMPGEPMGYNRQKPEGFMPNRGGRRQPQSQQVPRGSRRNATNWWPGPGGPDIDVGDELYLGQDTPTNSQSAALAALMMPQAPPPQPPRRQPNNRRTNNMLGPKNSPGPWNNRDSHLNFSRFGPPAFQEFDGNFFDNELMNQASRSMPPPQQVNHILEQLLLASNAMGCASGKCSCCDNFTNNLCSCQTGTALPRSVPVQQPPPPSAPSTLSQQTAQLLSRPLRPFDNIDGDTELPPSKAPSTSFA